MSYTIAADFLRDFDTGGTGGGGGTFNLSAIAPLAWNNISHTMSIQPAGVAQNGYVTSAPQNIGQRKTAAGFTSNTSDSQQFIVQDGATSGTVGIANGALTLTSPSANIESISGFRSYSTAVDAVNLDGGLYTQKIIETNGKVKVNDATDSTDPVTGSLVTAGGISVTKLTRTGSLTIGQTQVSTIAAENTHDSNLVVLTNFSQTFVTTSSGYITSIEFESQIFPNLVELIGSVSIVVNQPPQGTILENCTSFTNIAGGIRTQKIRCNFAGSTFLLNSTLYAIRVYKSFADVTESAADWYPAGNIWYGNFQQADNDLTFRVYVNAVSSLPVTSISSDGTMAANSDVILSTQKAIKTYVDGKTYPVTAPLNLTSTGGHQLQLSYNVGNYVRFNTDTSGQLSFSTTAGAFYKQCFLMPMMSTTPTYFANSMAAFGFGDTGTTSIYYNFDAPLDKKADTNIIAHIHWFTNSLSAGNIYWNLYYSVIPLGVNSTTTTAVSVPMILANDTVAPIYKCRYNAFASISTTGVATSSIIALRLARLGDDVSDTYTGGGYVMRFGIIYETDKPGSITSH